MRPPRNHDAFTLIELLAVITVIAILSSLLFAAFGRARTAADSAITLSNLRKVSAGILSYASENNGYTPPSVVQESGQTWLFNLIEHGYLQDDIATQTVDGTWVEKTQMTKLYNPAAKRQHPEAFYAGGFGINVMNGLFAPIKVNTIPEPTKTILVADAYYHGYFDWALFDPPWDPQLFPNTFSGGAAQYAFFDGHVQRIKSQDPSAVNSPPEGLGSEVLSKPRE